ncbi:MAG: tyrosine-type recombinase/integrase [Clostridia bacterium]|nr:tyrosine-type recombinase/integrase [Clostridia bacterium]
MGYDESGNAVTKRLCANDELSLADKVIEAVVRSGRIKDFLNTEIEFGHNELKLLEEAKQAQKAVKKTPFREYISIWHRTFKSSKAANTEVFLRSKQNVLLRWFGEMAIEDITPSTVQDFLTHRAESYKKATVKADWAMLKEVLDSAVSDGIILKNPAKDKRVHNPAKAGNGTASLTREQISAIQKAIPTLENARERCLIALLAYTSMRREEVLGLMWENVDFEKNCLEIRQAVVYPVSVAVTKETKNEFSVRTFPMGEALRTILFPCRMKQGYVIAEDDGSPLSSTSYGRLWRSLKSHIELYGMTAINFRTTFATMAVASGVDIKTTQALMAMRRRR